VINSLLNNFFFHLLINKKQLTPISSEKKKNEIVFLDVSLKEEADSSNMLVNFYQNMWLHLPEDNVHTHCREKFKPGDITHSLTHYLHVCTPTPTTHTHTHTHTNCYTLIIMKIYCTENVLNEKNICYAQTHTDISKL